MNNEEEEEDPFIIPSSQGPNLHNLQSPLTLYWVTNQVDRKAQKGKGTHVRIEQDSSEMPLNILQMLQNSFDIMIIKCILKLKIKSLLSRKARHTYPPMLSSLYTFS